MRAGWNCWAKCMGDCAGRLTAEHYVSRSVFPAPMIKVQHEGRFPMPSGVISVEGLARKALCHKHNSGSAVLDSAAGALFETLRESERIRHRHHLLPPYIRPWEETLEVRADLLERWLLKVAINFANESHLLIGATGSQPGVAPPDLVRTCFGRDRFKGRAGMYVAAADDMQLTMGEYMTYREVLLDGNRLIAAKFELRGLRFVLSLDFDGPPDMRSVQPFNGDPWSAAQLMRPFECYTVKANGRISHRVRFTWRS